MIYIEKSHVPHAIEQQVAQISSSAEWKTATATEDIRGFFDTLDKDVIRQALVTEQHHLCAYCMKRIQASHNSMTIEHRVPLSVSKTSALSYTNFLGVCKGGADIFGVNPRITCCDAAKSDTFQLALDPMDAKTMSHISYESDGTIYFDGKGEYSQSFIDSAMYDINDVLRLNGRETSDGSRYDTATKLLKGRRDAWELAGSIIDRLRKAGKLTKSTLDKEIGKRMDVEVRDEFIGVIVFRLERETKMLDRR